MPEIQLKPESLTSSFNEKYSLIKVLKLENEEKSENQNK